MQNLSLFKITTCHCQNNNNDAQQQVLEIQRSDLVGVVFSPYDKLDCNASDKSCLSSFRKKHVK